MSELPPIADQTPSMEPDDRSQSRELSLRRLRPPLRVPGYEQEQFVGRGAFGEVWSAIDSNSGRKVAIKFYSRRGSLDWSNMAREVEKLRFLFTDRYVVQLLAVGWDANPPYFVMEYMPFGSLADLMAHGPLPAGDAVKLFREIAVGLAHAHGKGVLHCDLKPSNIMLDQDGKPRLADFGQSRLSHEHMPSLGTFFYMAPEQAQPRALPDVRWDVYALGAILYQMLSGRAPHQTDDSLAKLSSQTTIHDRLEAYSELLKTQPKPSGHRRPGVDAALAAIVDRCLAVNPSHRYANVQAVLDALKQRDTRRAQRPLFLLGAIGPAFVVLAMASIALWIFRGVLSASERQLTDRTLESNSFAAHLVGDRFALEIDKRWAMLEQAAKARVLIDALAHPTVAGDSSATLPELQAWIEDRHKFGNTQFSPKTPSSYWFVIDQAGYLRAVSPLEPALIGRYFGYRDYFHGRGDENDRRAARPPIRRSHRSNVFLSQPANVLSVAFSAPIFDSTGGGEPLGVLAMEADLGHFAEFVGARNQFASIIDLRPDETGKRGLIAEHPESHRAAAEFKRNYVAEAMLDKLQQLRTRHAANLRRVRQATDDKPPALEFEADRFESYRDPLIPEAGDDWLCAAEPVFVAQGKGPKYDTGWTVLVQERRSAVLTPLRGLWRFIVIGGLAAIGLVVLILTGLWGYVLIRLRVADGAARFLQRLTGLGGATAPATSSRSEGFSALSERSAEKLSEASHG